MTIQVIPSDKDVPLIQEVQGSPEEIRERVDAFFKTAEFLEHAGAEVTVDEEARKESREIFNDSALAPVAPTTSGAAYHLKALLNQYDHQVLDSNIQARNYIVNRFLDISNPHPREVIRPDGERMFIEPAKVPEQLKALELLGKVSEIGLFAERIEVNINNKSTEELETELAQTLAKYMGQAITVPAKHDPVLDVDLDKELGRDMFTINLEAPKGEVNEQSTGYDD